MNSVRLFSVILLGLLGTGLALGQYGDISDLKVAKAEDKVDMKRVPAPEGAVVLFDGKSLDGWVRRDGKEGTWKLLEGGVMEAQENDLHTRQEFDGDFKLHVEFRVPYMGEARGQKKGNSGVYVQGRYEVQILDSYGLKSQYNDCGAIYEIAAPLVNSCKAPTVWQTYDIEFHSPVCENGQKTAQARMTVYHNGVKIHDDVKLTKDNTRAGMGGDPCKGGPIMLQFHGDPVQFRNVWLKKQ